MNSDKKEADRGTASTGSEKNTELHNAQSQLPKCTLDYLEHGAPEGSRNAELHKHACQFRDAGICFSEASDQLGRRAHLDGLPNSEIEHTIASAYRGEQREPIGHAARYSNRPQTEANGEVQEDRDRARRAAGPYCGWMVEATRDGI